MSTEITKTDNFSVSVFSSAHSFELAQRIAGALAKSDLVPKQYQNNLPNAIIALEMANRIGMSPLMVMQNLYIVHGNPSWSSKFIVAAINTCGKFSPIRYEFKGEEGKDDWGCRAWANDKSGERLNGSWVTIAMSKKEGWFSKNGSKWQTMPELMLQYRAAAFFGRTYAPEVTMGMQTEDEVRDTIDITHEDVTTQVKSEIQNNANKQAFSFDNDDNKGSEDTSAIKPSSEFNDQPEKKDDPEKQPEGNQNKGQTTLGPDF